MLLLFICAVAIVCNTNSLDTSRSLSTVCLFFPFAIHAFSPSLSIAFPVHRVPYCECLLVPTNHPLILVLCAVFPLLCHFVVRRTYSLGSALLWLFWTALVILRYVSGVPDSSTAFLKLSDLQGKCFGISIECPTLYP